MTSFTFNTPIASWGPFLVAVSFVVFLERLSVESVMNWEKDLVLEGLAWSRSPFIGYNDARAGFNPDGYIARTARHGIRRDYRERCF